MRRGILGIVGSTIARVERPPCARRPISISPGPAALRRRLVGARVADVSRLGKRVVIELDGAGDRLVLEPRMTGLVLIAAPPTEDHLRLRLWLEGGPVPWVAYWDRRGLGSVRLLDPAGFAALADPARIGPDALGVTGALLRARLGDSRRPVKVGLLDQRALAGVGNIYAAEALFEAGIHPERRCDALSPREWERLARALRRVLADAVLSEGSDLGDGTYRTALSGPGRYQNQHRVYGRAGQPCPRCRAAVERTVLGQRATFHCARCQPA